MAGHDAPLDLHDGAVVVATEKVLIAITEERRLLVLGQPEGRAVAPRRQQRLGAPDVLRVDQEVEVGEGADAGVAVEGFAERRPLERDHRDAAAVERGVKPAELRDSEQVLPLREDPGGPESIRNVPRNGLSAGDGVKERNQPLALGGREEPFPGGGGEREPVEGGPRPTVDPGAGRGQERLRRDRPAPRLRCPPWPRHAGRARPPPGPFACYGAHLGFVTACHTNAVATPRAAQAQKLVKENPGITIRELADKMGIKQNYLYRVLPQLEADKKVRKKDKGWYPV